LAGAGASAVAANAVGADVAHAFGAGLAGIAVCPTRKAGPARVAVGSIRARHGGAAGPQALRGVRTLLALTGHHHGGGASAGAVAERRGRRHTSHARGWSALRLGSWVSALRATGAFAASTTRAVAAVARGVARTWRADHRHALAFLGRFGAGFARARTAALAANAVGAVLGGALVVAGTTSAVGRQPCRRVAGHAALDGSPICIGSVGERPIRGSVAQDEGVALGRGVVTRGYRPVLHPRVKAGPVGTGQAGQQDGGKGRAVCTL